MFRRRDRIIAVISGIFFLFSASVFAFNKNNGKVVSCDAYAKKLPYLSYGLQTPPKESGWTCMVAWMKNDQSHPFVIWKKNKDKILLSEAKIGIMDLSAFKPYIDHAATTPEPMKSIRLNTEAYLGSPEFAKKNELTAGLVEQFAPNPKRFYSAPIMNAFWFTTEIRDPKEAECKASRFIVKATRSITSTSFVNFAAQTNSFRWSSIL